jgi:hypothetical protein
MDGENQSHLHHPKVLLWSVGAVLIMTALLFAVRSMRMEDTRVTRTRTAIKTLADDVEGIRRKLGRIPTNEVELARLIGTSIPRSGWNESLEYRTDKSAHTRYWISAISRDNNIMIYVYDSGHAEKGVESVPF